MSSDSNDMTDSPGSSLNSSISMEDLSKSPSDKQKCTIGAGWNTICIQQNGQQGLLTCAIPYESYIDQFHAIRSISDTLTLTLNRHRHNMPMNNLVDELMSKYFTEQGLFSMGTIGRDKDVGVSFVKTTPTPSPCKATALPGNRSMDGELLLVSLNGANIGHLGNLTEMAPLIANVTELDLGGNSLGDWMQITTLLSTMPNLSLCNLSHNPLTQAAPLHWATQVGRFEHQSLRGLVLNATGVKWSALYALLEMLPGLEELHLSLNDYSGRKQLPSRALLSGRDSVDGKQPWFPSIKTFYINLCHINEWKSLCRICTPFTNVENLVAAENPIMEFGDVFDSACTRIFGRLHTLNINRTHLKQWTQVSELRRFPQLRSLRITDVPFMEGYTDLHRWHLSVARLPDVCILNGSHVTAEQRIDAERFYLRHYADDENKETRYSELEQIHGRLEPLANIDLKPKQTANVSLIFEDKGINRKISLHLNQTIAQLKREIESSMGIGAGKYQLFLMNQQWMGCEELRLNGIMLYTLGIEDGDEISIKMKPEPVVRRVRTTSTTANRNSAPEVKK